MERARENLGGKKARTADEAKVTKCAEIAIVATASQRRSKERRWGSSSGSSRTSHRFSTHESSVAALQRIGSSEPSEVGESCIHWGAGKKECFERRTRGRVLYLRRGFREYLCEMTHCGTTRAELYLFALCEQVAAHPTRLDRSGTRTTPRFGRSRSRCHILF